MNKITKQTIEKAIEIIDNSPEEAKIILQELLIQRNDTIQLHPQTSRTIKLFVKKHLVKEGYFTKNDLRKAYESYPHLQILYPKVNEFIIDFSKALGITFIAHKNFKGKHVYGVCMGYSYKI